MFTVTPAAAEQIRKAARDGDMEGMALRVAASKRPDGTLDYAIGFDDATDEDLEVKSEGVRILIGPAHAELLKGAVMDFVEIEAQDFRFIFKNPNDANYSPAPD